MQISKTRMDELDKLVKAIQGSDAGFLELDDKQATLLSRLEVTDSLLKQYGSPNKVARMMMHDSRFDGLSKSRCLQLIDDAMHVYGARTNISADYFFGILLDKTFEMLPKMIAAGDWKAFNSGIANVIKVIEHFKSSDAVNKDLLKQHDFTLMVNVGEKAFTLPLAKMMELKPDERQSFLNSIKSELIPDNMVEYIEDEERQ